MDWVLVISLCLLCLSVCGIIVLAVVEKKDRQKREKDRVECMRMYLEENRPKIPGWWLRDPNEPLERLPDETDKQFLDRVSELALNGGITPNAARISLGLEPFPDKPDDRR